MRVAILTDSGDLHTLEFDSQMEIENIKALLEADCGVPASEQQLIHNDRELSDPKSTFETYKVNENDIISLRRRPQPQAAGSTSAQTRGVSGAPAPAGANRNWEDLRQHILREPSVLRQMQQTQPELAQAAVNNPARFYAMIEQIENQRQQQQSMADDDPYDLEAQQRIAEAIRLENVAENLASALEYNPESFGRVTMLYIEMEVNRHPVKAFVDSGAQATIMSPECAEACGIMRLVDKRFAGVARGVGVAKILGKVHSTQIRIGDVYLPCSFTIMEGKGVDLLFGLDMLKRYQACIDLAKNALIINGAEIPFLSEHELPNNAKVHEELTPEELATINGGEPSRPASAPAVVPTAGTEGPGPSPLSTSAAGSSASSTAAPVAAPTPAPIAVPAAVASNTIAPTTAPAPAPTVTPAPAPQAPRITEESIRRLMDLGFNRGEVIAALEASGGDVDVAASYLF